MLLTSLHKLSGGDVGLMKQIIDQSLDNEWKKFFAVKTGNDRKNNIDSHLYDNVKEWAKKKQQEEQEQQEESETYDDFGVF